MCYYWKGKQIIVSSIYNVASPYYKILHFSQVRHSQRANDPLLKVWVMTDAEGAVKCGHCTCMAGLGEVCSHVGAILFYAEANQRIKTCTDLPCSWIMPSTVNAIPYKTISEIDFTKPKSIIRRCKRGAHVNNDCEMLTDSSEIEVPEVVSRNRASSTFDPNMVPPQEDDKQSFFSKVASLNPAFLSLIPSFSDKYIPTQHVPHLPPPLTNL